MNNLAQLFIKLDNETVQLMSKNLNMSKTYPWEYENGPIKKVWEEITSPENLTDLKKRLKINLNIKAKKVYKRALFECRRRTYESDL